jgi:transcriptional regulator with XRE-family HTH domain
VPFRPDRLKALREVKGLSQEQLGKLAGLSHSAIAKNESGRTLPGSEVLESLARALDCTIDYLHGLGPEYENPMTAAAQMAFEVAGSSLTVEQRERCRRVLRHPDAPRTTKAWVTFAEMLDHAIGSPTAALALVKTDPKPTPGRRHHTDSSVT